MPGRIPASALTIIGGDPDVGKSQFTCLIAGQLSRGELGDGHPAATLFVAGEDDPSTIRARVAAVGGDVSLVRIVRAEKSEGFVLPDDVVELERLVAEYGVKCVVIDPVTAHLSSSVNSHRDAEVRSALLPLMDLAHRHSCAVIAVMHLNKSSGGPSLYRLSGSVAFSGAPRSVLLFTRDPDDPGGSAGPRRALAHDKCNIAPKAPTLLYGIQSIVIPASGDDDEVETSRLELIGETTRRANELLAFEGEERSALDEAEEFLLAELSGGLKQKAEIVKAARREGIADRTLRRARERLGVKITRSGFPSRTYWSPCDDQMPWSPLANSDDGHDWPNPHHSEGNGRSDGLPGSSRGQSSGMGTTSAELTILQELERLGEWVA